jgi:hypothetical protein
VCEGDEADAGEDREEEAELGGPPSLDEGECEKPRDVDRDDEPGGFALAPAPQEAPGRRGEAVSPMPDVRRRSM